MKPTPKSEAHRSMSATTVAHRHAKALARLNASLLADINAVTQELRRHTEGDMLETAKHARALLRLLAAGRYEEVRAGMIFQ